MAVTRRFQTTSGRDLAGSRDDVVSHVTIGLAIGIFLHVVNYNHTSILHGYGDMKHRTFRGHDLDLVGSRDVIVVPDSERSSMPVVWRHRGHVIFTVILQLSLLVAF